MAITAAHLQVLVTADTGDAERKLKGVSETLIGLGGKMSAAGGALTLGMTVPLVGAGVAAIKMASDYQESLNKVRVVFGEASGAIEDFANSAAANLRMSKGEAMAAAGTFGNLFVSMGSSQEEAAKMSEGLLQLGADLASFNNIPAGEALKKLQSAMVGSYEPLDSLGAKLSQATVEAKALEMGLWDGTGTMDEAALMAARYALIMEKTAVAHGDAANTSGELAGQMAEFNAQLGDMGINLGDNLQPMALLLAEDLNNLLIAFNNLSPGTQEAIVRFGVFAAAAGPVLFVLGKFITGIGMLVGALAPGGALAGAFSWLVTFISATFIPALAAVGAALAAISLPVWLLIGAIVALVAVIAFCGKDAAKSFSMLAEIVGAVFKRMLDDIKNWGGQILTYIQGLARDLANNAKNWFQSVGKSIVDGIWNGVQSGWNWLMEKVKSLALKLLAAAQAALGIKSPSQLFALEVGKPIAEGIGVGFSEAMSGIGRSMADLMKPQGLEPAVAAAAGGGGGMRTGRRQAVNLTVNIGGRELRRVVVDAINQELVI
jgi:hypothetical protein